MGWTSRAFFTAIMLIGYRIKPRAIPLATLKERGIVIIVIKQGTAIASSLQRILPIFITMNAPTMISADEVISGVTISNSGEKNKEMIKQIAITTEVNPVRPPTAIPALDSTNAAVVDVPKMEPAMVDKESAKSALPAFGISLFFINPAWLAIPINAPAVSKKATNKNVKITANNSGEKMVCR